MYTDKQIKEKDKHNDIRTCIMDKQIRDRDKEHDIQRYLQTNKITGDRYRDTETVQKLQNTN